MLSGIVSSFYKRIVWREEVSFPRSRGQILIQDSLPLSPAYSTQVLLKNTKPPWEEKHEKVGEVSWSQAAGTLYKQWHASRRHEPPVASSLQSQLLSTAHHLWHYWQSPLSFVLLFVNLHPGSSISLQQEHSQFYTDACPRGLYLAHWDLVTEKRLCVQIFSMPCMAINILLVCCH